MKIASDSNQVNRKVGYTPIFHDFRKVLVKLRPSEHRIAETLWGVAHGRWDETFSRQYLCVCTETKPKYLQEILKSLSVLGLIRMERLGRDKYRFEPASPSKYPAILETLAQRPKLGRPKGSTKKNRVAEVPVKVRATDVGTPSQLALFGDADLEYRQSFVRCDAQLELPGLSAVLSQPPVDHVNRTSLIESEEDAPPDAVSLVEQEMNEWSAQAADDELSPSSSTDVSLDSKEKVVEIPALVKADEEQTPSVPSEQTPSAPVSEIRPIRENAVPGDLVQFDPALLALAKEAIALLKVERPRDPVPNLRTLCPLLAPMVQISSAEIVLSYLKDQMASMCGRPSVGSPLHVLCSPKWYVRGLERVSKSMAPRKPSSIKVTREIQSLIAVTKDFQIEVISHEDLVKNLASLLDLGTLEVAAQYLRGALIELMPKSRAGEVHYPLQVACHAVRAREGMWQIEKSLANREIARTFNSLVDSQVLRVASSEKAVDSLGSLMSPWLKGTNVKPNPAPAPLKLVPAAPDPAAPAAPVSVVAPVVPLATTPSVSAIQSSSVSSGRVGYRMPWDTQEQARTNGQGARAALAALQGPAAQPTLPKDTFSVENFEDGKRVNYKGCEYVYVAAKEIWKRTKVVR